MNGQLLLINFSQRAKGKIHAFEESHKGVIKLVYSRKNGYLFGLSPRRFSFENGESKHLFQFTHDYKQLWKQMELPPTGSYVIRIPENGERIPFGLVGKIGRFEGNYPYHQTGFYVAESDEVWILLIPHFTKQTDIATVYEWHYFDRINNKWLTNLVYTIHVEVVLNEIREWTAKQ